MPRKKWKSVTLPESLYKRLKQRVEDSRGRYISISEVVREAIWKHLNEASR